MSSDNHRSLHSLSADERDRARHEELCAFVFGELQGAARDAFEARLAQDAELRAEYDELVRTVGFVRAALPEEALPPAIRARLSEAAEKRAVRGRFRFLSGGPLAYAPLQAAAGLLFVLGATFLVLRAIDTHPFEPAVESPRVARVESVEPLGAYRNERERGDDKRAAGEAGDRRDALSKKTELAAGFELPSEETSALDEALVLYDQALVPYQQGSIIVPPLEEGTGVDSKMVMTESASAYDAAPDAAAGAEAFLLGRDAQLAPLTAAGAPSETFHWRDTSSTGSAASSPSTGPASPAPPAPARETQDRKEAAAPEIPSPDDLQLHALSAFAFAFCSAATDPTSSGAGGFSRIGFRTGYSRGSLATAPVVDQYALDKTFPFLSTVSSSSGVGPPWADRDGEAKAVQEEQDAGAVPRGRRAVPIEQVDTLATTILEGTRIQANETPRDMFFRAWGASPLVHTADDPLSTFSIDVDTSSYTLARRTLLAGHLPQPAQVRTEEFLNYFRPDVEPPADGTFRVTCEAAPTPFLGPSTEMLRVSVRAKEVQEFDRRPLALTFVVDVSGSMEEGGRLELVKEALGLLTTQLSATDACALISFTNDARVLCPMTSASNRGAFEDQVSRLVPEGGTNVEAGLMAGYRLAAEALTTNAVNRVVLLSDGVGNIGETDQVRILEQAAEFRSKGIYLNTIGVGMNNHDDAFLEQLADKGDGLNQYIDSAQEAEKALVDEFTKTLQPVARDVKIQVEFDPAQVESWRQLGYENRVVADADFRNDAVDAGEVNAGHQVTALYEIVRTGAGRRQSSTPLATVRVRHKPPFAVDAGELGRRANEEAEVAAEQVSTITPADMAPTFEAASFGFRRSVLVAQFAEVLRRSVHVRDDSLATLLSETRKLAETSQDPELIELLSLMEAAQPHLDRRAAQDADDELAQLLDQLARLRYEQGVREQVLEQGEDPDEALETSANEEIEALEASIRALLYEHFGVAPAAEEAAKPDGHLEQIGYGGDDDR